MSIQLNAILWKFRKHYQTARTNNSKISMGWQKIQTSKWSWERRQSEGIMLSDVKLYYEDIVIKKLRF